MKKMLLLLNVLMFNIGFAQTLQNSNERFIKFVNSFKEYTNTEIIDFTQIDIERLTKKDSITTQMTKDETLEFVYKTKDTTKLYCNQYDFSSETEEIFGISTELYLPYKYIRINMGKYSLIVYSFYDCQYPDKDFKLFLNLCIVDDEFNLRDSIIVYEEGRDRPSHIKGLLNPKNSKLFLINSVLKGGLVDMHKLYMYRVNDKTMKFELIKESHLAKGINTSNLINVLEKSGRKELFLE